MKRLVAFLTLIAAIVAVILEAPWWGVVCTLAWPLVLGVCVVVILLTLLFTLGWVMIAAMDDED